MKLTSNFSLGNMHQQIMLHHSATIEFNFRTSFTGCLQGKKHKKTNLQQFFAKFEASQPHDFSSVVVVRHHYYANSITRILL